MQFPGYQAQMSCWAGPAFSITCMERLVTKHGNSMKLVPMGQNLTSERQETRRSPQVRSFLFQTLTDSTETQRSHEGCVFLWGSLLLNHLPHYVFCFFNLLYLLPLFLTVAALGLHFPRKPWHINYVPEPPPKKKKSQRYCMCVFMQMSMCVRERIVATGDFHSYFKCSIILIMSAVTCINTVSTVYFWECHPLTISTISVEVSQPHS